MEEKKILRKRLIGKMESLPEKYREEADREIVRQVLALEEFKKARVVFCYVGVGKEINTWPIIEEGIKQGKTVAVPKCIGKGIMAAYAISGREDLVPSFFGLLEPQRQEKLILPAEIDFALVPCVACNYEGLRLGWGGGYYDRYLANTRFVKAILCREELINPDIPGEGHDVPADMVITEKGVYRKSEKAAGS